MTDLDAALASLSAAPVHPRLATIDAEVLDRLVARTSATAPLTVRSCSMAAIAALGIGILSSAIAGEPASAATSIAPFGAPSALAPSTLLGATQ